MSDSNVRKLAVGFVLIFAIGLPAIWVFSTYPLTAFMFACLAFGLMLGTGLGKLLFPNGWE